MLSLCWVRSLALALEGALQLLAPAHLLLAAHGEEERRAKDGGRAARLGGMSGVEVSPDILMDMR